jgi:hypothetical protein
LRVGQNKVLGLIFEPNKDKVLFITQENSLELGSVYPRGSPTAENLRLEADIFQLRKHYAQLKPYIFDKIHMFLSNVHPHCQGQSFSPE